MATVSKLVASDLVKEDRSSVETDALLANGQTGRLNLGQIEWPAIAKRHRTGGGKVPACSDQGIEPIAAQSPPRSPSG